jgi:ABC-type Fe3+-hydroxamate transport system substrate-binding protein
VKIKNKTAFILLFALLVLNWACTGSTPTTTNANQAAIVTNTGLTNANVATNTAPANVAATNNAATNTATGSPSAIIQAYYQAMVKKDEAAFRRTLSQATLKEFEAGAKQDGDPTLVAFHTGYSSPPSKPFETRNEQMSGNAAMIEVRDSEAGAWRPMRLVREGNEWKLDLTDATTQQLLQQTKAK